MGLLGSFLNAKELIMFMDGKPLSMDGVKNSHREMCRSIIAGEMNTAYFREKWPGFQLRADDKIVKY